jgi:hypothetical protein
MFLQYGPQILDGVQVWPIKHADFAFWNEFFDYF